MDLSIDRADQDDQTVMSLGGEIDVYTAPLVRERLDEAIRGGRVDLIVDLTGVRFLDSTGLGVLVGRLKLVRARGGSLRLVGARERVLKVFAITGLDKVFEIYGTLAEALAAGNVAGGAVGAAGSASGAAAASGAAGASGTVAASGAAADPGQPRPGAVRQSADRHA